MEREDVTRRIVTAAVVVVVIAIGVLLFTGGSNHVVYADFSDAGQLVNGDLVTVAGHQVGGVGGIKLTDNGLARVELDITDDSIWPLKTGTRAQIRQLSLTGVANRYVGLTLSDSGQDIPDNGVIPDSQTTGIVDLDVLLDALTPQVRRSLQQIIKTGAYTFSGNTPRQGNLAFKYFNPAISQLTNFGRQVVADRFALDQFVSSSAQVARALASRNSDLGGAVTSTAQWLSEVASERSALEDAIGRAPAVMSQSRTVLADLDATLSVLNPTLSDLQPVAPGVASLLRNVLPAAQGAVPLLHGVQALVTPAKKALAAFPPVARTAVPAVKSLATSIAGLTPILSGLRPYIPDQVAGFFTGVGGAAGVLYDANGGYGRIAPIIAANGSGLSGVLGLLGSALGTVTGVALNGQKTGQTAACPGGGDASATDGSNPWTSPDTLPAAGTICNTASNVK